MKTFIGAKEIGTIVFLLAVLTGCGQNAPGEATADRGGMAAADPTQPGFGNQPGTGDTTGGLNTGSLQSFRYSYQGRGTFEATWGVASTAPANFQIQRCEGPNTSCRDMVWIECQGKMFCEYYYKNVYTGMIELAFNGFSVQHSELNQGAKEYQFLDQEMTLVATRSGGAPVLRIRFYQKSNPYAPVGQQPVSASTWMNSQTAQSQTVTPQ